MIPADGDLARSHGPGQSNGPGASHSQCQWHRAQSVTSHGPGPWSVALPVARGTVRVTVTGTMISGVPALSSKLSDRRGHWLPGRSRPGAAASGETGPH